MTLLLLTLLFATLEVQSSAQVTRTTHHNPNIHSRHRTRSQKHRTRSQKPNPDLANGGKIPPATEDRKEVPDVSVLPKMVCPSPPLPQNCTPPPPPFDPDDIVIYLHVHKSGGITLCLWD